MEKEAKTSIGSLAVRLADLGDAWALSVLGAATFLETYAEIIGGSDILAHCESRHAAAVYEEWLRNRDMTTWVAETGRGAPVGYLVLMPNTMSGLDPADMEVQRIYVLSRYHGSGLGAALLREAVEAARNRGARQLVLGVMKINTRAVNFYRREGFAEVGTRTFQVGQSIFEDYVFGQIL